MTPETVDHYLADIRSRVASWRNGELVDPPLQSELLAKALTKLGDAAAGQHLWAADVALFAEEVLEELHHRAVSGIPFGEPDERPYEYTLDAEERGGH